jgi:hypothetical protein
MNDVILGLVAILAGGLFCFRGYLAFRIVIPIWGAFVGFAVGGGLVATLGDQPYLGTATGWIVAVVVAIVFAALAYFVFEVAVAVALGSIGFSLAMTILVALGASWEWWTVLIGAVAGLLLACAIVSGIMLLVGEISARTIDDGSAVATANDGWGWYVLYLGLAIAGVLAQQRDMWRRITLRDAWETRAEAPVRTP